MEENTAERTIEQPIGTTTRVPPEDIVDEPAETPIGTRTRVPER